MKYNSFKFKTLSYSSLAILYLIINVILYFRIGVKVVTDSPRYIDYASQILETGHFYQDHNLWYIGYVFLIVVCKCFSESPLTIVLAQIVMSGVAIIALYKASQLLFRNGLAAFITVAFYLLFVEISIWNFYALAESFYGSMMCIAIYTVVKAYSEPTNKHVAIALLISLIASVTKPTGISLLLAGIVLIFYFNRKIVFRLNKTLLIAAACTIIVLSYILIDRMLQTFTLIESYEMGEIVYGIISPAGAPYLNYLTVSVDCATFKSPSTLLSPVIRLTAFIWQNPLFFLKICLSKLFWYLAHIKPYFSQSHNLFIALMLYPAYFFYGICLRKRSIDLGMKLFLSTIIICNCLIVALTSEDWDGRFIVPILPALFLFAGKGMSDFISLKAKV